MRIKQMISNLVTYPFRREAGGTDVEERGVGLVSHSLGQHRLPVARGTKKQQPPRRRSQAREQLQHSTQSL